MVQGFVLVDTVPGREDSVYQALGKVPAVLARRKLTSRAKNAYEILALVEGETIDDVERVMVNHVRSLPGVQNVAPISPEFTMTSHLQSVMQDMEREVKSRLEP